MTLLSFFLAAYALLAIPGPTNTLLATAGAGAGISRSLHLLAAELCGYGLAIALLRLVLGPIVMEIPVAGVVLRLAVTLYVLHLAGMLWRARPREPRDAAPVRFGHVLLATLLNPKALIFAFALLPLQAALLTLVPWLALLALQIVTAGAAWIAFGATLGRGLRGLGRPDLVNRLGATALVAVAGVIWLPSLAIT
jgi:threonine/homoserine/homoserine lactone efflux protein